MAPTNLTCLRFFDRTRFKLAVCGFRVTSTVGKGTNSADGMGCRGLMTLRRGDTEWVGGIETMWWGDGRKYHQLIPVCVWGVGGWERGRCVERVGFVWKDSHVKEDQNMAA